MKKISITKIRKKLTAMQVSYQQFTTLQKIDDCTVLLTITVREEHDDNATIALGVLDEDYHVKRAWSPNEVYRLTVR